MGLYFEVLDGEQKGTVLRVRRGTRIGRTTGELMLKDPKISSLHAQVEADSQNRLLLVDRGSSNGLKINGARVTRVSLLPGVTFQVGKTYIKVIEKEDLDEADADIAEDNWELILQNEIPKITATNMEPDIPARPLNPAIKLKFLEGLHTDEELFLGFGPRTIGSSNLDIEISEQMAPPTAFRLIPTDDGTQFITDHNKLVLLNNSSVEVAPLAHGDLIRIGETLILVEFL